MMMIRNYQCRAHFKATCNLTKHRLVSEKLHFLRSPSELKREYGIDRARALERRPYAGLVLSGEARGQRWPRPAGWQVSGHHSPVVNIAAGPLVLEVPPSSRCAKVCPMCYVEVKHSVQDPHPPLWTRAFLNHEHLIAAGLGIGNVADARTLRVQLTVTAATLPTRWTQVRPGARKTVLLLMLGPRASDAVNLRSVPDDGERAPSLREELSSALSGGVHQHIQLRQWRDPAHRKTGA